MVFLIQNTQNRDSIAVQLKLDELICALKEADNRFLDVEDLDDKELGGKTCNNDRPSGKSRGRRSESRQYAESLDFEKKEEMIGNCLWYYRS